MGTRRARAGRKISCHNNTEVPGRGSSERVPPGRHDLAPTRFSAASTSDAPKETLKNQTKPKKNIDKPTKPRNSLRFPLNPPPQPSASKATPLTASNRKPAQKDCASARSLLAFYGSQNKRICVAVVRLIKPPPDVNAQIVKEKKLVEESPSIYFRIRDRRTSR